MTAPATVLDVVVVQATMLTPQIRAFRLRAADGARLPGFEAGAHVKVAVEIDGRPDWRAYSLIALDPSRDPHEGVDDYLIAVRREEPGRGGSRHLHERVALGDRLRIGAPQNDFALAPGDDDVLLLAGGIGITPLASMARALRASGRRFALHYSGRNAAQLAFVEDLRALAAERLHLYADDEPARALSVDALLAGARPGQPVYVCGPKGMIDAVIAAALQRGWPRESVRSESFVQAAPLGGDQPFEVECRASGRTVPVPADKTLLDALLDAGLDPLYDCKRGDCGVCTVGVIEGEIDHRDYFLSDAERAAGKTIQVCVSRARGARLVLDI
jgi:vanillate O-demethylase ferredoxin subunit